jgi:hypothetical protein
MKRYMIILKGQGKDREVMRYEEIEAPSLDIADLAGRARAEELSYRQSLALGTLRFTFDQSYTVEE